MKRQDASPSNEPRGSSRVVQLMLVGGLCVAAVVGVRLVLRHGAEPSDTAATSKKTATSAAENTARTAGSRRQVATSPLVAALPGTDEDVAPDAEHALPVIENPPPMIVSPVPVEQETQILTRAASAPTLPEVQHLLGDIKDEAKVQAKLDNVAIMSGLVAIRQLDELNPEDARKLELDFISDLGRLSLEFPDQNATPPELGPDIVRHFRRVGSSDAPLSYGEIVTSYLNEISPFVPVAEKS